MVFFVGILSSMAYLLNIPGGGYNFFIENLSQGKDPAVSWAELLWDVMVHILLMKDPSVHNLTSLLWRHRKKWDRIGEKGVPFDSSNE